jgi:hypothetical protein
MEFMQNLMGHYRRHRFACLFWSLVVTLVAAPVFAAMGRTGRFLEVFVTLNLLASVFITRDSSLRRYAVILFLALFLASWGAHALTGYRLLLEAGQGGAAMICLLSVVIMFHYLIREGTIDSERIFAALSVYLMTGIMCGLVFSIFENVWPGSFAVQGSTLDPSPKVQLAQTLYFSFVTLGTLGYGDIIPVSGPARALAVVEAIGGQMYLVVVVARLVSLHQEGWGPREVADQDEANGGGNRSP